MEQKTNFQNFLDCWQALPRSDHAILPSKSDCTPRTLGALISHIAIFEYKGKHQLIMTFSGSELERLSGAQKRVHNYYDLVSDDSKPDMHAYHQTLMKTPCGAYVGDIVTTRSGESYLFETLQFPLSDDKGVVRYLMAYCHGRRPTNDTGHRDKADHTIDHIRDMHFMDLGAGAPSECIVNYERRL